MPAKGRSDAASPVEAVQAVYSALEPFDDSTRQKVLASVTALLGMAAPAVNAGRANTGGAEESKPAPLSRNVGGDRPKSIVELMQEKQPKNNSQKIALFAYHRERVEGLSRFAKADLKSYFAAAKEKPAANYDRDFNQAVKFGWIHEDGSDSYLTSRGLEAVESGFAGGQPSHNKTASAKRNQSKAGRKSRR
jgi:hypothetical protein